MNIKEVHPVLPVKDVSLAIEFYVRELGFELLFTDVPETPKYAGVKRDAVEVHLQWHDASEWKPGVDRPLIRLLCTDPDLLFKELGHLIKPSGQGIRNTAWGTREFGIYDPSDNGLIFYKNL